MDDLGGGGGGGGGGGEVCRRQRFTVELRPGETTIVSWKKLVRDAARAAGEVATSATAAAVQPPVVDSRLAPGQPAENELKDGHPSRFGAVIEKIERLYMGNHSSEEEDLNDVPDDDEYDTEDSFIDDTELDNYFQVDNSAIKHDGFFVNRGKLERINKPTSLPSPQQKKRRRKDLVNTNGDEGELPNKLVKVGNKVAGKSKKLVDRNIGIPHVVALPSVHNEEMKYQDQTTTSTISAKKRSTETKASLDPFISSNVSNNDAALSMIRTVDRQNPEILTPENQGSKSKDGVKTPNALVLKSHDKSVAAQSKSEPAILSSSNGKLDQYVQCRKKDVIHDRPNLNVSAGKVPMQNAKTAVVQRKVDSIIKPKSTGLGKTIEELEKMVAESIPRSTEVQDDDVTSQATGKRRLPREVKQKLAKVARLAQASYGRIPDELVNQLMGILGHVVQMRTLKRNLKDMVAMGLTAKKEKDDRMQQMTKDVAELIRLRVPYMKSKVLEHQAGQSGDFQEMAKEEQEIIKRKYGMDDAIEDKISDLYDLYVNGLDEDAGPQARKLYAELANLWPKGFMDNHGIKRAICRSKDRKRALWGRSKDQEKIKQKKLVAKTEGTVRVETSTVSQPHHMQEKPVSEPNTHSLTLNNKPVSKTKQTNSSVKIASSSPQTSNPLHPNQDKVKAKGSSSINLNEKDKMDVLAKKKMKRKPERELVGGQSRMEKPASLSGDEKVKSHKQVAAGPLQKPSVYTSPPLNLKN